MVHYLLNNGLTDELYYSALGVQEKYKARHCIYQRKSATARVHLLWCLRLHFTHYTEGHCYSNSTPGDNINHRIPFEATCHDPIKLHRGITSFNSIYWCM